MTFSEDELLQLMKGCTTDEARAIRIVEFQSNNAAYLANCRKVADEENRHKQVIAHLEGELRELRANCPHYLTREVVGGQPGDSYTECLACHGEVD